MRVRKLGVVGAGTMGSGIAALAASAGIPVVLLDIPGTGADRSSIARGGLERAKKSKPAAFMDLERAAVIEGLDVQGFVEFYIHNVFCLSRR